LDFVAPGFDFVAPGFAIVAPGFAIVAVTLEIVSRSSASLVFHVKQLAKPCNVTHAPYTDQARQ
jgi:hypothetical protein